MISHAIPPIFYLIYVSRSLIPAKNLSRELDSIWRAAQPKNRKARITGLLIHHNGSFIQLLEGEERIVRSAAARIENDARHDQLRVLFESTAVERSFDDWSMAKLDLDEELNISEEQLDDFCRVYRGISDAGPRELIEMMEVFLQNT